MINTLINKYKKMEFIQVEKDGAPERYSECMRTFHNMNIMVQTTGGDTSPLNRKNEIPNKTLDNTRNKIR